MSEHVIDLKDLFTDDNIIVLYEMLPITLLLKISLIENLDEDDEEEYDIEYHIGIFSKDDIDSYGIPLDDSLYELEMSICNFIDPFLSKLIDSFEEELFDDMKLCQRLYEDQKLLNKTFCPIFYQFIETFIHRNYKVIEEFYKNHYYSKIF